MICTKFGFLKKKSQSFVVAIIINFSLFISGVHFLSNITDVIKIPAKFPNDINILSWKNWLFIASLEANGTNPESQLANDMVVYQYSVSEPIIQSRTI